MRETGFMSAGQYGLSLFVMHYPAIHQDLFSGRTTGMPQKGSFKNIKLGKNIHRQLKRRGFPDRPPAKQNTSRMPPKER
jgi:hypothetical protein